MEQMTFFDEEKIIFPLTHEDILKIHKQYISEGETDPDAFTWADIQNGRSYFFYGKKVFEHIIDSSGKSKLRIQQKDGKAVTVTSDSPDFTDQVKKLKETKQYIFRNLITDTFACCNDFERCSDALKCIHPENRFYNGCLYRKNLEAGKIFYGKNKNI